MNKIMHKPALILFPVLLATGLFTNGCSKSVDGTWKAPLVYRIDIQQGNVIEQDMINKLKPGMDKNQVKFIMGTPLITDPFHSNRWDYVYSMEPGGGERQQRRITLYFENDKLAYVDGDIQVRTTPVTEEETRPERNVVVPIEKHEEGFFGRWFGKDKPEESGVDAETALAEEPATEESAPEAPATETDTAILPPAVKDETTGGTAAAADATANKTQSSVVETEQDKNLLRRFWDRMTSKKSESGIQEGEESERDLRDAEVFEKAGGEL
jgi:outer membrane protein assembly factor BamE